MQGSDLYLIRHAPGSILSMRHTRGAESWLWKERAMTSSERLNLLGMLWYHGSKSQKDAEASMDACSAGCCYIIREHQGTIYLSTRYRGMYYHLPISHTKHGYILKDHYNAFPSLQELVSHHQEAPVYVENGDFTLQTSCHKDFSAYSVKYINDLYGPCTIQVKEDSITVKKSNDKEVGKWPYIFIREFRFEDEKLQFMFKSGRRGPFGVAEYQFKLHNRTYYDLRETVNRIAEGRSGSATSKASEDYKPPVPSHGRKVSTPAIGERDTYDDLPMIKSLGHHRSASNPDLTRDINFSRLLRKEHGSTRSSPTHHGSPQASRHTASPEANDYQTPKPAIDIDYAMPRPLDDPRNDYQIPKPLEETYKVPRPVMKSYPVSDTELFLRNAGKISERIIEKSLEHSYEDIDNLGRRTIK